MFSFISSMHIKIAKLLAVASCTFVGTAVGAEVGAAVGAEVGAAVGTEVGAAVGAEVGAAVTPGGGACGQWHTSAACIRYLRRSIDRLLIQTMATEFGTPCFF